MFWTAVLEAMKPHRSGQSKTLFYPLFRCASWLHLNHPKLLLPWTLQQRELNVWIVLYIVITEGLLWPAGGEIPGHCRSGKSLGFCSQSEEKVEGKLRVSPCPGAPSLSRGEPYREHPTPSPEPFHDHLWRLNSNNPTWPKAAAVWVKHTLESHKK